MIIYTFNVVGFNVQGINTSVMTTRNKSIIFGVFIICNKFRKFYGISKLGQSLKTCLLPFKFYVKCFHYLCLLYHFNIIFRLMSVEIFSTEKL